MIPSFIGSSHFAGLVESTPHSPPNQPRYLKTRPFSNPHWLPHTTITQQQNSLTFLVHICSIAAAPEMIFQLTPGANVLAAQSLILPRARHIATRAVVLEVHLQAGPGHGLLAVAVIGAHNHQLVQYLPHQQAAGLHVFLADRDLVCRTGSLHLQVALEAVVAERVPAGCVHGLYQRLHAYPAEQLALYIVRVVVQVVLAGLVTLAAAIAHYDITHTLYFEAVGFLQAPRSSRYRSLHDYKQPSFFTRTAILLLNLLQALLLNWTLPSQVFLCTLTRQPSAVVLRARPRPHLDSHWKLPTSFNCFLYTELSS